VPLNSSWGVVLLEQAKLSAPATNTASISRSAPGEVTLSWMPVTGATSYELHRGETPYFTPDGANTRLATVPPPAFDAPAHADDTVALGDIATNHFYVVPSANCTGLPATSTRVGEFDFAIVPGSL